MRTGRKLSLAATLTAISPAGPTRLLQTALQELSELLAAQNRHEEANTLLREALNTQH